MHAHAVPTARQREYQDWEWGVFLHFGIRTFCEGHRDWDGRVDEMTPDRFLPSALDCHQWAETASAAGARYMVLTAKHHDGFANWPSRFTSYGVASSPWKNGKGDVVREYVEACRAHDLKVGLYYSPADASSPTYDDPAAYDEYFIRQIGELLGGDYGAIDIVWFDGCGSENHAYDWRRIVDAVRRMQPEILIFSLGDPDFRWVGNEAGVADTPHGNTVDASYFANRAEGRMILPGGKTWLPAECDLMMRDNNWFFSEKDESTVKTPEELLGIYYYSVGRGCNMLVNIGPDRRGLLPEADVASLQAMGREISRRFARPLLSLSHFTTSDGKAWRCDVDAVRDRLPESGPLLVDHAVIREGLRAGEHIRRFRIRAVPPHAKDPITVCEGHTVGHKAICPFPTIRCNEVVFEILDAAGPVELRSLDFYHAHAERIAPRAPARPGAEPPTC